MSCVTQSSYKEKIMFIIGLLKAATLSGNSFLRRKAYVEMKELVDRIGLEMMKNVVDLTLVKRSDFLGLKRWRDDVLNEIDLLLAIRFCFPFD